MRNLLLAAAASGILRNAHFVVPNGRTIPERTLLIERASTNLVLHSRDMANAAWTKFQTSITTDAEITGPDGVTIANVVVDAAGAGGWVEQACTFTGDGVKAIESFLRFSRFAPPTIDVILLDVTAGVVRRQARLTAASPTPTLTNIAGTGSLLKLVDAGNGWWWVRTNADGVVAANTNRLRIAVPASVAGATFYHGGSQLENSSIPSSEIPTTSSTVTRNEDVAYLPLTEPPQPLTVYVRFIELGTGLDGLTRGVFSLGESNTNSLFVLNDTANFYRVYHRNGTDVIGGPPATQTAYGDLVELRVTLSAAGVVQLHQTINGGTEESGSASNTIAMNPGWDVPRVYLGARGANSAGLAGLTHVAIAKDAQSRETMRQLAGVLQP